MARTVRDANLETRTARDRLTTRKKPYWRTIDPGRHIGYYKGARGGSWIARYFLGRGRYIEKKLGIADDTHDADAVEILSFSQAQERARAWFAEQARKKAGLGPGGPYTVANAIEDYLDWFSSHRKSLSDTRVAAEAHILPKLGHIEVSELRTRVIREWHEELAATPARVRTRKGQSVRYKESTDRDDNRPRKATANRILTVLKAALNRAYREGDVASDEAWRRVERFRGADVARVRYLTRDECVKLVNACAPDFRKLVQAAFLTGARYGELTALTCADFNRDSGTAHVRDSKGGKPRHIVLTDEGREFFDRVTAGRSGGEIILLRANGKPWKKASQRLPLREACERVGLSGVSFHILRHTYAATLAMSGAPMAVIARNLGHASTAVCEKHYAHLSESYVSDTVRKHMPRLGINEPSNVVTLTPNSM